MKQLDAMEARERILLGGGASGAAIIHKLVVGLGIGHMLCC